MAPSLTGRGWGWVVSSAAEAVRRFPGPPLEDPPTSPPHKGRGRSWGERGGTQGARAAPSGRRRSVAAAVPAGLAQRLQREPPNILAQRRLCGRRATKRSDWRGGRAAARTSRVSVFCGPASGMAVTGVAIWPAPHRAQRPASRPVRQAGPVHAQREGIRARDPRARERAAASLSRRRRPDRVRVRVGSPSGARRGRSRWLDAQRNSPAPQGGDTSYPKRTWHQRHQATQCLTSHLLARHQPFKPR